MALQPDADELTPDDLTNAVADDGAVDDEYSVLEQDDGSAIVSEGAEDDEAYESPDFDDNLAESLPDSVLAEIGQLQVELVESDRKSGEDRDKQYSEGIKRTGLGKDAPGGATFDGASNAVHPMLAKGCVDFASRAIKELFPASGPCKTQIIGEANDVKIDKADRKKRYMNWQLATRVSEQRAQFERLLSQLPLGGSQYKRWWWDANLERPRTETVYVDDVFLPYSQGDFYSSYRVTHRQWVSADEFDGRIGSGLYRDIELGSPDQSADKSLSKKATDKVEGIQEDTTVYNEEGLREIYLMYVDLEVDGDDETGGEKAPYILHLDKSTEKVLGLYRNWKSDDELRTKKHWMVEYIFIPWRGAKGVGLYHLIGSLAAAGTGALRALLDSAHISNFPGGLKLKGGRTAGQSIQVNATELAEIDAPPGVDDIRKLVMPFPFAGPSQVLFNIMEWITNQSDGVIATANDSIADAGANMPVGTALALIEHGSVNFSAIHARCHASLKRELEILHRIDAENITDQEVVEELGELVVTRDDFQGPMDVIPVSDPNIFSEAQRYAQLQAVMQLSENEQMKPFFKADRLLQRALRLLQITDCENIANLPKDPTRIGALEENYLVGSPEPAPLKVYQEQDDIAHLEAHLHFLTSPIFGANPLIGTVVFGPMMAHLKDHLMSFYRKHASAAADAMEMIAPHMGAPITRAQAEAKGSAFADKTMATLLGPMVMPALQQAQKLAGQFAPKPPVDPQVQAQITAGQATTQVQLAANEKLESMRLSAEQGKMQAQFAEADKERQNKLALKNSDIMYQASRDSADRDLNDRATTMATAIEKHSLDVTSALEQFKVDAAASAAQAREDAALQRQQDKAESDAQLMVLSETLKSQLTGMAPPPIDIGGIVQPLVDQMQGNTTAMMEQLAQGLGALHSAHAAPRIARYIKGPDGSNIGVESVIQPPTGAAK
jgi:hypothetical protein